MDSLKRDLAVLKAMCGILLVLTLLAAVGQVALIAKMTEINARISDLAVH